MESSKVVPMKDIDKCNLYRSYTNVCCVLDTRTIVIIRNYMNLKVSHFSVSCLSKSASLIHRNPVFNFYKCKNPTFKR